jgi:hypothetical protein
MIYHPLLLFILFDAEPVSANYCIRSSPTPADEVGITLKPAERPERSKVRVPTSCGNNFYNPKI